MSHPLRRTSTLSVLGIVAATWPAFGQDKPSQKIAVKTAEDLPRHMYKLSGTASELMQSADAEFMAFAQQVRMDVERDLATYDIADTNALGSLHRTLLTIDMLAQRYEEALERIDLMRKLETKEGVRLTIGLAETALIAAMKETGKEPSDPATRAAFQRRLAAAVASLPWELVQDAVKEAKGRAEISSENYIMGAIRAWYDPIVAKAGEIGPDTADGLLRRRFVLKWLLPVKDELVAVYADAVKQHEIIKPDIWADREVELRAEENGRPVVVGIWDFGVDPSVFSGRIFVNPAETLDGKDNDGNGFVDDIHGIAFDFQGQPSTEMLRPLGDAPATSTRSSNTRAGIWICRRAWIAPRPAR